MVYVPGCSLGIVVVPRNENSKDIFTKMLSHMGCNIQGYNGISVIVWHF